MPHEALDSQFRVDVHHDHAGETVELFCDRLAVGPHEQREVEHDDRAGSLRLLPSRLDLDRQRGVHDVVDRLQFVLVVEDDLGDRGAIEGPVDCDDPLTPPFHHGLEHRRARLLELPHDPVGVDQDGAPGDERVGHGRLAGADSTGESDLDHGRRR